MERDWGQYRTGFDLFVLVLAIWTVLGAENRIPKFESFPAVPQAVPKAADPKFKKGVWPYEDPRFREAALTAALQGPNFGGKFTIINISCGTGCGYIAVLDQATGAITVDMPFFSLLVGPFQVKAKGERSLAGLSYRLDSRLMVAEGCFDTTDGRKGHCSTDYFLWNGKRFSLLKRISIALD